VEDIEFTASFGLEQKTVVLSPVRGAGGCWHLYVDKYFWGQFDQAPDGTWAAHLQRPPGWLTGADIEVLCDLLYSAQAKD